MAELYPSGRPYLRTPVIAPDGTQIAFVHASDVWLVDASGGKAERLTANPAQHASPRWSPDGKTIAVSSTRAGQGSIHLLPLESGTVRRLTLHDAASTPEAWTPDGTALFYSSWREQLGKAVYRINLNGGTPIRWINQPYETLENLVISPDGSTLAFNVSLSTWWRRGPNPFGGAQVWTVSNQLGAGDYQHISNSFAGLNRWPMWAADQQGLYVVSDRDGMENIWYLPLGQGEPQQITFFREGRVLWPTIAGQKVVFERDFRLWRLDLASGDAQPLDVVVGSDQRMPPPQIVSFQRNFSEIAISPDGKKIGFVAHGEIFADFADKETDRERRQGPSMRVTNTHFRESDIEWSPDSRTLVYTSDRHGDEEVYKYDFAERHETRLTSGLEPKHSPRYSPDGAWIAYASGENAIRLLDTKTNEDRDFIKADFTYSPTFAWSPDSKWLAFVAQDEGLFSNLYVQHIDETEPHQISFLANIHSRYPIWAGNGQFILFTTSQYREESQIARIDLRPQEPQFREDEFERLFALPEDVRPPRDAEPEVPPLPPAEQPLPADALPIDAPPQPPDAAPAEQPQAEQPVAEQPTPAKEATKGPKAIAIQFDGIERRLRFLTPTQLNAYVCDISPDSRDMLYSAVVADKRQLWLMPLDEQRRDQGGRQLTGSPSSKGAAHFGPEGKSIYFLDDGRITNRRLQGNEQTVVPVQADVLWDFHAEKQQMFDECWRLLRDHFYDPTFRGLDWTAAKTQFAPLVEGAQTDEELRLIINLMVGELRASHMGAFGGQFIPNETGYIGLLFDQDIQFESGQLRIAEILTDSPGALARDANGNPLHVGDYLLAVDGVALTAANSLDGLLHRTVNRRVRLTVGAQPEGPTRDVAVRPVSGGRYSTLRYLDWVLMNERYVHRVSNGRLGYVHIHTMSYDAYQKFLADLDSEIHSKQGVVIDVRFNGGGHIATFILDVLSRRSILLSAFRDRPAADVGHLSGNRVLNKPTVLVTNEHSGSNTEMFSEGYRRLGLGKVIGKPTAGAVIWTSNYSLIDGTQFRLPRTKVATPEGEDLEGTGRAVDVDIALPIGEYAPARDRQLDMAVEVLLKQIDEAESAT